MSASAPLTLRHELLPERMPPIPEAQRSPAQQAAADLISAGPRGGVKGPYNAILRSPGLTTPMQQLGAYIRFECKLALRINEMAALITARHWSCQFEWQAHEKHARAEGLAGAIIAAIAEGRRPDGMAGDEVVTYDFVSELLARHGVCDATYERGISQFGEEGLMDLMGVVGYYSALALIMNVARTRIPGREDLPLLPWPLQMARA
jgi:4-carboxymuconolactone decarboxylase